MFSPEEPGTLPDDIWRSGARKNVIDSDVKWLLQQDHNAEFCSLSCTWEGTIKRAVAKLGGCRLAMFSTTG